MPERPFIGAVMTGFLLFSAFPPLGWSWAGWVALIPLLALCMQLSPAAAARLGGLSGAIAWLLSLFWLTRVTWIGWMAVSLYCALYLAAFAAAVSFLWRHMRRRDAGPGYVLPTLGIAALWVSLEFLRAHLFTGFPWNLLAVSQYSHPELLQAAAWGGVYAVSFVMAGVSALVAICLVHCPPHRQWWRPLAAAAMLAVLPIASYAEAVFYRMAVEPATDDVSAPRIALLQLNIPQQVKWDESWTEVIYRRLEKATADLLSLDAPDLVIWPETVMPDFFRGSALASDILARLLTNGVPIVAGSMDWDERDGRVSYYNASFFLTTPGDLSNYYFKRHLVMFGEYLPLERWMGWVRRFTPVAESFTPGTEATVFQLASGAALAPLICFEDIMPGLARASVRRGGRLLVNQTNDAWFDPLAGARQHMAHCVFRCIENRTPAARAANTGITCFIDRFGQIVDELPPSGHFASPTTICRRVFIPPADMPLTYYTRYGDWFAWTCVCFSLAWLAAAWRHRRLVAAISSE
jgi:apolipoprotein N-acyltransferase